MAASKIASSSLRNWHIYTFLCLLETKYTVLSFIYVFDQDISELLESELGC